MVGQKFNRWTVLKVQKLGKTPILYCECACGMKKKVKAYNVLKGTSKSCGCFQRERVAEVLNLGPGQAALNQVYSVYKTSAKQKGHDFTLSKKEFFDLINDSCYFCGKAPSRVRKMKSGNILFNGIDRADNAMGYVKENCLTSCTECNYQKGQVTKQMIYKLYEFFEK